MTFAHTALIFPGQGSQMVGMGKNLAENNPVVRQTFEEADEILGYALSDLCFNGPADVLNETSRSQPALYVAGIATLRALYNTLAEEVQPGAVAGHSLGQLTALTAAGSMSFSDGLNLVQRRGELMRDADQLEPGGMAALLGPDIETVEGVCTEATTETGGVVVVANDNCPGQVVIAGAEAALNRAMELAKEAGAKRVVRLDVSIAAHSPLMAPIADDFAGAVNVTPMHPPVLAVIGNVSADVLPGMEAARAELKAQLTSRVRWTESVQRMRAIGIEHFVELGSGKVLTGLLRRIDRGASGTVIDSVEGLETYVLQL